MRDKIVEMLQNKFRVHKDYLTKDICLEIADRILALFDISKIEVEIKTTVNNYGQSVSLTDVKATRPATWSDIEKGGVLRRKE